MPPANVPSSAPLLQNTAPILEFRCLFTPDLKKKQKKWKDGRLKFHTFNKRIMVYDDRANYVGDTHYHMSTLEVGEELELERGILVEVGELIGKQDQDLDQILQSVQGAAKSARHASMAPERGAERRAAPPPAARRYTTPAPTARQTSMISSGPVRPLSALLGTPSGHHGRALMPTTSPFEDRQNRLASETPEPKRRKVDSTPSAEPLWPTTTLIQSRAKGEISLLTARPAARELSYPDSIAPKARVRKTFEKSAKTGYAQKLTGAVLDLSGAQKTNMCNSRQQINLDTSDDEDDNGVSVTGVRERAIAARILPPIKRKPALILPPKKPTEIVDPESTAPKAKPRRTFDNPSKADYASVTLDLSGSNMTNVTKRQPSIRQPLSANDESEDKMDVADGRERLRVETRILPPQPKRKPPAILPPSAPRAIVYPDSIAPKQKAKKTFEKKSKAGYAEKLIGAALNLTGTPISSIKRSQPIKEKKDFLARLPALREQPDAGGVAAMEELEPELSVPKVKKARISYVKASSANKSHAHMNENEQSLFEDHDFVDIDDVVPRPVESKPTTLKKPRALRQKKQAGVLPDDVEVNITAIAAGSLEESQTGRAKPSAKPYTEIIPIRNASQVRQSKDDSQNLKETPNGGDRTHQTSLSANTGSLRIIAKRKRTMLMMQSIPPQRAASSAATPSPRPAILPEAPLTANNQPPPEPSQATKALTEFHSKQNEKLQERRRKIEARKRVPIEIHSSPEFEPQDDNAMDMLSWPIDVAEKKWGTSNAIKSTTNPENAAPAAGKEMPVQPIADVAQQQSPATPSSPHSTNENKPFTIQINGNDVQDESEKSATSHTDIGSFLCVQHPSPLLSKTATNPDGLLKLPAEEKGIRPPHQPNLPQQFPVFTQVQGTAERRPPDNSDSTKSSSEAANSSPPGFSVQFFNSRQDDAPQSSLFVRDDSPETIDTHLGVGQLSNEQATDGQVLFTDDDNASKSIRAQGWARGAAFLDSRQSSQDWPSDDESRSEVQALSPQSKGAKTRPIVDFSESMASSDFQAEEGGFGSSRTPVPHHRELSAADEERLAKGHSILVKIKSGIRSKEIIRPNSLSSIRNCDNNPFIGFVRPRQPIVRIRTGVDTEAEESTANEDDVDEDEVMVAQAEEERQTAWRLEEAQRRTREFRKKRERERLAKAWEEERLKAEAESQAEGARQKHGEEARLLHEKQKAQQILDRQGERALEAEKKLAREKDLEAKMKGPEDDREHEAKRRFDGHSHSNAEEARLEKLGLEAVAENRSGEFEEKMKAEEEAAEIEAKKQKSALVVKEASEAQEVKIKEQKENIEKEMKSKLDEQAKYEEMRLRLQQEIEAQMQEKYRALEEELRLKLEAQNERDRLEKERQEAAERQTVEDLRLKDWNEAPQRELDTKKVEEQKLAALCEQKKDAEKRMQKELANQARQQRAVETAAAKLANSALSLPRSVLHAVRGFRTDEAQAERGNMSQQSEYQKRVNTSFGPVNGNTVIEHIDILNGGSFGEGDLVLAQPKVTAFKPPAARSQAAMRPQAPRPPVAMTPHRSFHGFPTHLQAAMHAKGITTATHDLAPTFQSTPPAVGYKVPSTLHLSAPTFKPFCKPKSVPIVPKKAPKTMKEIRDEKRAERDQREDLIIIPGFEEKGEILSWETGAWTKEAGDLFGWRPKAGDEEDD